MTQRKPPGSSFRKPLAHWHTFELRAGNAHSAAVLATPKMGVFLLVSLYTKEREPSKNLQRKLSHSFHCPKLGARPSLSECERMLDFFRGKRTFFCIDVFVAFAWLATCVRN